MVLTKKKSSNYKKLLTQKKDGNSLSHPIPYISFWALKLATILDDIQGLAVFFSKRKPGMMDDDGLISMLGFAKKIHTYSCRLTFGTHLISIHHD